MAVSDSLGSITNDLFSGTLGILLIIILVILGFAAGGGLFYYFRIYRKKYDITVKVISRRAGEDKVYFDKAAIINDKKNATSFLRLQKSKLEIELPRFDIFYHTNKGDYVEILRKSDRDIRFITPPKIDKEYVYKKDGKLYRVSDLLQREIENDISWIINREKQNKSIINPESILMKLLMYMPQIISGVLSFMVLWMVLRYAPELLAAMEGFAKTITQANNPETTTEVIGSIIPLILWKLKQ